ncbi:non-hydrolyzing UDP-N-acetylglucosamine 2-epimerase [Croceimicrobium sp.]|uniref:non-hydrolyzing UDP-N-acetylglucosamine 2-epimerase n=1 Tax=Croceimicrobium sp. TaxID=2828340 RepID=UPI003BADBA6F
MKVATVVGARPQFIKAAPLSRALKAAQIEEFIVHTGQHQDANMSGSFFSELGLAEPRYQLSINNLPHGAMTGRMLEQIESILLGEQPDMVVVFGDTNSTLAGALAAKKAGIPVAHIEAGMRSGLDFQPEEINRILTDHLSSLLLTSNEEAKEHLLKEGISEDKIVVSGDLSLDLFRWQKTHRRLPAGLELPSSFALLTLHRQENVDEPARLKAWIEALEKVAKHISIVCPLHPRTQARLDKLGLSLPAQIIPPCGHAEILGLTEASTMVLTDSGGLQKEAYFSERPCLTLREATEWTELVEGGSNMLCEPENLEKHFLELQSKALKYPALYGDGKAAIFIARKIREFIESNSSLS